MCPILNEENWSTLSPAASLKGYHRPHHRVGGWSPPHPRQEWPAERDSRQSGDGYFLSVTRGGRGSTKPLRSLQFCIWTGFRFHTLTDWNSRLPGWGSRWLTNHAALLFTALARSFSAECCAALMAASGGSVTAMLAQKHSLDGSTNNFINKEEIHKGSGDFCTTLLSKLYFLVSESFLTI